MSCEAAKAQRGTKGRSAKERNEIPVALRNGNNMVKRGEGIKRNLHKIQINKNKLLLSGEIMKNPRRKNSVSSAHGEAIPLPKPLLLLFTELCLPPTLFATFGSFCRKNEISSSSLRDSQKQEITIEFT